MESKELLLRCIEADPRLGNLDAGALADAGDELGRAPGACLSAFWFFQGGETAWAPEGAPLRAEKEAGGVLLCKGAAEHRMGADAFFALLGLASDIYLPALPLGSAVRPRAGLMPGGDAGAEPPLLVVAGRFHAFPGTRMYAPYAGVPYPTGDPTGAGPVYFGPQLVGEVVREAYADGLEAAFVARMREALLLGRGLHSMAFATREEADGLRAAARGAEGGSA